MNIKFNLKTKISFNGQEYDGVEAMPAEVRQAYEQVLAEARTHKPNKVMFNGHEYDSPDEMPAEVRGQYDQVMAEFDKDHNGIPDMLESGDSAQDSSTLIGITPLISNPVTPPENKGRIVEFILIGVIILLLGIVVWFVLNTGLH
jgi:hypothetical protein